MHFFRKSKTFLTCLKTVITFYFFFNRAYGSPSKRKRGGTSAGRGTSSPAGPATPNVDYVLGHLELLRQRIGDSGVFATDSMQAALLQVRT
jgi:hypothetical protein